MKINMMDAAKLPQEFSSSFLRLVKCFYGKITLNTIRIFICFLSEFRQGRFSGIIKRKIKYLPQIVQMPGFFIKKIQFDFSAFKKALAFSLIELMISLIVVSCVTAAFTPVITKKLKSSTTMAGSTGNPLLSLKGTQECNTVNKIVDNNCSLCYISKGTLNTASDKSKCIVCKTGSCAKTEYNTPETCKCETCISKHGANCYSCTFDKCMTCVAGKYMDGGTCKNVPSGKFTDPEIGITTPKDCPEGYTCSSSACTGCSDGVRVPCTGDRSLKWCHNGKVENCPEGSVCSNGVKSDCTGDNSTKWCHAGIADVCPEGSVCTNGKKGNCPTGTNWCHDGKEENCPDGYYCSNGRRHDCPENKWCHDGKSETCTDGYTCTNGIRTQCTSTNGNGNKWCHGGIAETCTEGYTCTEGKRTQCTSSNGNGNKWCYDGITHTCPDGYWCTNGKKPDNPCKPNCVTCNGASSCGTCSNGYFTNNSACAKCPDNSTNCSGRGFSCSAGWYPNGTSCSTCHAYCASCTGGAVSNCQSCNKDRYLSGTTCKDCPANASCPGGAASFSCNPGYGKSGSSCVLNCPDTCSACTSGTTNCSSCPAGSYLTGTTCTKCTAGYYCTGGTSGRTYCPDGTWSNDGAKQRTDCTQGLCGSGYSCSGGQRASGPSGDGVMQIGNLYVFKYNLGDHSTYSWSTKPSSVTQCTAGSSCSLANSGSCSGTSTTLEPACWKSGSNTGASCSTSGYNSCTRTVCNWTGAKKWCESLGWRLPTSDELATIASATYNSTLNYCSNRSSDGVSVCQYTYNCLGSYNSYCRPYIVWSGTTYGSNGAYTRHLNNGWYTGNGCMYNAFSVRCVKG